MQAVCTQSGSSGEAAPQHLILVLRRMMPQEASFSRTFLTTSTLAASAVFLSLLWHVALELAIIPGCEAAQHAYTDGIEAAEPSGAKRSSGVLPRSMLHEQLQRAATCI